MKSFFNLWLTSIVISGVCFAQAFNQRVEYAAVDDNPVNDYQSDKMAFKSTIDFNFKNNLKSFSNDKELLAFKAILKGLIARMKQNQMKLSCFEIDHDDNPTVEVVLNAVGSKKSFGYRLRNIPENFSPVICLFNQEIIITTPSGQVISDSDDRVTSGQAFNVQFRQVFVDNGAQYQADPSTHIIKMSVN